MRDLRPLTGPDRRRAGWKPESGRAAALFVRVGAVGGRLLRNDVGRGLQATVKQEEDDGRAERRHEIFGVEDGESRQEGSGDDQTLQPQRPPSAVLWCGLRWSVLRRDRGEGWFGHGLPFSSIRRPG